MSTYKIFNVAMVFFMFTTVLSIKHRSTKGSFTIHQTTPRPYIKSGPAQLLSAYQRLNSIVPSTLRTAAAANNGAVDASPSDFDAAYLTSITIGGQTFNVPLYTGSDLL